MEEEMVKEALVVCTDECVGVGITIWDMENGNQLLHIPTCSAAPHGMLCLRNQYLVAAQIRKHGSHVNGAIFFWPLNKPQSPLRSYTMEAIGPISCTRSGAYLAGGAPSGNAYLWQVVSGRLLKNWHAHNKLLKCLAFSNDESLLVTAADDGVICVWSVISLLNETDHGNLPSFLYSSLVHKSTVTGLLCTSSSWNPLLMSSSVDGTCKVRDLVTGRLLQSRTFPVGITAIVLDPEEQILFAGSADGRIFLTRLDVQLEDDSFGHAEDQHFALKRHNGSITALTFSELGLVSAAEDLTACIWDISKWDIVKRFTHQKGPITNLVMIPQSTLLCDLSHMRVSNQFHASVLEKCPQPSNSSNGIVAFLRPCTSPASSGTSLLDQQIEAFEQQRTSAALWLKIETCIESRIQATSMSKYVMYINKHLQSYLLDMMRKRFDNGSQEEWKGTKLEPMSSSTQEK